METDVYLAGSVRTPIGAFCGALSTMTAVDLSAVTIKAALHRAGVPAEEVDQVIIGNILSAGCRPNVARQAAIHAGIGDTVPAFTINQVCASGLKSVALGVQAIRCDEASVVVAGGTESMSLAPYLLLKGRTGYRMGNGEVVDSLLIDSLQDAFDGSHMGACGDRTAAEYGFSREAQDDYAIESYTRANAAMDDGTFADEIVPVEVPQRKATMTVAEDEEPRRFNPEKMRTLRPAFDKEGTVTAANASSVDDGAASVVLISADKMNELGVTPQAKVLGCVVVAREPEWFTLAPIKAISALLDKLGMSVADVDLFEINEAFSVVPLVTMRDLGIGHDKVNVHGGAVALGHPLAASGARTLATLLNAMKRRGARIGVNALCVGGGMGIAMAVEHC